MYFCFTRYIMFGWFCGWLDFYFRYYGQNTKIPFTRSDGTAYSDGCARYWLTAEVRWCGFYSCDVSDLLTPCSGRRVRRFFLIEMVFRVVGLVHRWLMVWQVAVVSFIACCALRDFTHIYRRTHELHLADIVAYTRFACLMLYRISSLCNMKVNTRSREQVYVCVCVCVV